MFKPRTGAYRLSLFLALALLLAMVPAVFGATSTAQAASPSLAVAPNMGTAGTNVTLAGAGYTPRTSTVTPTVSAAFTDANGVRTTLPQTTTTDSAGGFALQLAVPSTAATGPATFTATDSSGVTANTPFDVRPAATSIGASPNSGLPNSTTTITGTGFAVNEPITLTFVQGTAVTALATNTVTTTNAGSFSAVVTIPATAAGGAAAFTAQDRDNNSAATAFTVTRAGAPTVAITPTSAIPGSAATVTGTNFAINEPITLTFTQGTAVTTLAAVTTTSAGLFTTTVTIPGSAPAGAATVTAKAQDGNSATTAFTVVRNGAPTVAITPTSGLPASSVTVTGTNFAASEPVTLTFGQGSAATVLVSGTVGTDAAGAFTATVVIPSTAVTGTATITATDAASNTGTAAFTVASPVNVNNGPTTLYFAEGYTGLLTTNHRADFNETLSILNANAFTATVTLTYLIQNGAPVQFTRLVGPNSALRESVNSDIGPDKIAAAVVSSPSRITAERIIRRVGPNGTTFDASSSLGNPNLGKTFYFAEGYTGITFQEYLTLANPNSADAHVTVTFAPQANSAAGALTETFTVPADGRATRNINADTHALANKSVGMIVTSDQPIMAERVLYFGDGGGSAKYGSTTKAGIQTVANQYLFAYGSAGGSGLAQRAGDQSFVTVLNPGTSPVSATVLAQFYDATGGLLGSTSLTVAPGTRQTLNANAAVKNTSGIYATILTSSSPFVAEKPQYFGGSPNLGTHPGVAPSGAPAGVKSAAFPDLSLTDVLGQPEQQTVFLYNPTAAPIQVTGTYYASSASKTVVYTVAAHSIATVNVNTEAAGLPAGPLGATFVVTSTGANDQFVATDIANTSDGRSYTGDQGALPAQ